MKKLFVSYEVALQLKPLGIDYFQSSFAFYEDSKKRLMTGGDTGLATYTHEQVVNWLEEEHNIHLDRIWYNDIIVNSTRWVYHVESQYSGSDYDDAILYALGLIKTK